MQPLVTRHPGVRGDVIGRMGEDEFAVASTCSDSTDAAAIIQRLLDSPKAPFDNHGADVRVAASIGISRSGPGAATARGRVTDRTRFTIGRQAPSTDRRLRLRFGRVTSCGPWHEPSRQHEPARRTVGRFHRQAATHGACPQMKPRSGYSTMRYSRSRSRPPWASLPR